jgi:hypothetical protein
VDAAEPRGRWSLVAATKTRGSIHEMCVWLAGHAGALILRAAAT